MEQYDATADSDLEGLARNWRDSLAHALTHFSELSSSDYGFHNRKWIVLSVHHAAEVFSNYILKRMDASHPVKGRYPSLGRVLNSIQRHPVWNMLRGSEREVVEKYLPPLVEMRDTLMHRPAPEKIDVSGAAIALLALLTLVRRLTGARTKEFLDQYPPIEIDVVDELRVDQLDRYTRFVERVVREEVGDDPEIWPIRYCNHCGGATVLTYESECRACFQEDTADEDE